MRAKPNYGQRYLGGGKINTSANGGTDTYHVRIVYTRKQPTVRGAASSSKGRSNIEDAQY